MTEEDRTIHLEHALVDEINNRCRGRPTKRGALIVARILLHERAAPGDLCHALGLMAELATRIRRARV